MTHGQPRLAGSGSFVFLIEDSDAHTVSEGHSLSHMAGGRPMYNMQLHAGFQRWRVRETGLCSVRRMRMLPHNSICVIRSTRSPSAINQLLSFHQIWFNNAIQPRPLLPPALRITTLVSWQRRNTCCGKRSHTAPPCGFFRPTRFRTRFSQKCYA
jgi:hypothetical protein